MRLAKTSAALILGILSFGSSIAFAQLEQPSQCKVAVVNMEEVVMQSHEGQALSAEIEARVAPWKAKANPIQEEISNLRQKLSAQAGVGDDAAIAELKGAIRQKQEEWDVVIRAAEKDKSDYREPRLASISKSALDIAKQLAAERGMDTLLDSSSPTTRTARAKAGATACNITFEVKARMNAKFSSSTDPVAR